LVAPRGRLALLQTGPRGHAHYFEFFVYGCKSVRPYLSPLRAEERVGFTQAPLFVDLVGLPDQKAYRDALKTVVSDSRETKLPVAIPSGENVPGQGQRPELQLARAFVGEIPVERGFVIAAPGAKAVVFVAAGQPPDEPLGDAGIATLLQSATEPGVTAAYLPTPSSLAATTAGIDAIEVALGERGVAPLYSTDPEPMALRTAVEDSPAAAVVLKALRARHWRVEVMPASRAAARENRGRLSTRRRDADQRVEVYLPAGLRSFEMVRQLGHELLRIERCPRLASGELRAVEARALTALADVLADDLLRRRFGERLRSLRLGAYEWALADAGARPPRPAPVRMVEVAAAVAELLLQPEGYDVPLLIGRGERLSPAGVELGRRAFAAIRDVADPTDYVALGRALARIQVEVPLRAVEVVS
jgi:hypothetical protein